MDHANYRNTISQSINLIEARYQHFSFQRHYHLDFHIGLITQGEQKFHHQGCTHHVGHGQVVIMQPDELHDGHSVLDSGYQTKVFSLDPKWFSELAHEEKPQQVVTFRQAVLNDPTIFNQLYHLHQLLANDNLSQLAKDCLPLEGFEQLFKHYGYGEAPQVQQLGSQSTEILKEFIWQNIDQPIRLEQLSALCELTPTQFQRHFKAKLGISPYAWLSRLRLEKAMKLLRDGHSATQVAHQVGFYDQAHFSKAFKTSFGITPKQINS
ncbi:AraC family transcriptional regulator [Vibrio sp. 404]|uniref:AraC family transcriptional regulator n=1 Tax=Vibrio marinisediminis TaxID=2758441 RepID=A0A7W2FTX8_9VIBR|nr:AraC family transcriptional regulator [Vibrio marinisediminis]MBA5764104.1 AraC family transcriptional regulator [Vibrio marinisediminis]